MSEEFEKNDASGRGGVGHIDTRLKQLIAQVTEGTGKSWKVLEDETGIKGEKWRQFYRGTTKASGEMVEALAKRWPDYAYWLACGDTEPERGHIAPITAGERFPIVRGVAQQWATTERIFKQKLLSELPDDPLERDSMEKKLRDDTFKRREKLVMPAVQLCYERIMRALDQDAKDDFLMLECDSELRLIRKNRWDAEEKLQNTIQKHRKALADSLQIEKGFTLIGLTKLVSMWKSRK